MVRRGVRLKYLHSYRDRHGKMRHYFRVNGIRTALPGQPGSEEFIEAYQRCMAGVPKATKPAYEREREGSFRALARLYYGSSNFLSLKPSGQKDYRRIIDRFIRDHGQRRVDEIERRHVISIIGGMHKTPGAANKLLKRLRTLIGFAIDIGWATKNATVGVKSYKLKEVHTWTEEQIARFESYWPVGTKQRTAFDLLLYTGQRGCSDVRRMVWTDITGTKIRVSQEKTGEKQTIPLHESLQASLRRADKNHLAIISTRFGAAYTEKGFGNFMSDAIRKAGLPTKCKTHGLRKAAARRLAEAGCSSKQISAITGHKTLSEIERYTRAAEQERLAEDAIRRQTQKNENKTLIG